MEERVIYQKDNGDIFIGEDVNIEMPKSICQIGKTRKNSIEITQELYKDLKSICGKTVDELIEEMLENEWEEKFGG